MSWKNILKSNIAEVRKMLDDIKREMRAVFGSDSVVEMGELTEEIASDILVILRELKPDRYLEAMERKNKTYISLMTKGSPVFDIFIEGRNDFRFRFASDFFTLVDEGKATKEEIERAMEKFLKIIDRVDFGYDLGGLLTGNLYGED